MRHNTLLLGILAISAISLTTYYGVQHQLLPNARPRVNVTKPPASPAITETGGTRSLRRATAGTMPARSFGVDVRPARSVSGDAAKHSPEAARAQMMLAGAGARAARRAQGDAFAAREVIVDTDGTEHVRMERTYQGLPVIGGDIVLHSRNGQVIDVSGNLGSEARPSLAPSLSTDNAMAIAGADFHGRIDDITSRGLVVYAAGDQPVLAQEIGIRGASAKEGFAMMRYFIDAHDGTVLGRWNKVKTAAATATGRTLFSGNVSLTVDSEGPTSYRLFDNARGGTITRNGGGGAVVDSNGVVNRDLIANHSPVFHNVGLVWGDNTESNLRSVAADAHYAGEMAWDFYLKNFARAGNYNDGVGVNSIVNVTYLLPDGTATGENAAYLGDPIRRMTYGNGGPYLLPVVQLETGGHEITHGFDEATANFNYVSQSGALDEASADIMGTMIEFFAKNPNDTGDYIVGEKAFRGGGALRFMYRPSMDDYSADCLYPEIGGDSLYDDVHFRSGVGNHFFYLLAEGTAAKTYSGVLHSSMTCLASDTRVAHGTGTLVGIGRTAAQSIWYRAVLLYMTSTTNYSGARAATLRAAADLYGAGSANVTAVANAWTAVKVK